MKKFAVYVPPILNDVAQEKMFSLGYIWHSGTNLVEDYGKEDGMVLSTTDIGSFLFRHGRDYGLCDDHKIITLDEFFIMKQSRNAVDMGDGHIALILEDKVRIKTLLIDSKKITALCRTIQSTDFPEFKIKTVNPILNKVIQGKILSLGYKWAGKDGLHREDDVLYLICHDTGMITYFDEESSLYESHPYREITIEELFRSEIITQEKLIKLGEFISARIKKEHVELLGRGHSLMTIHADKIIALGKAIEILSKNETDSK